MRVTTFALVLGIVFILVGIAGFVPGLNHMNHPGHELAIEGPGTGHLLGLFPVNVLHNLVHLVFGAWGVLAGLAIVSAVFYARAVAIIYGALAIMGLFPVLNTVFGLVPIYGADIVLHALIALAAAYFGFVAPGTAVESAEPQPLAR